MQDEASSALIHLANVLYLASYSVRDILWLRLLSVAGMLCLAWCYYACAADNPVWWSALYWQFAFLSVNLVAEEALLVATWPEKYIRKLMKNDLELGTALQAALGTDLVQKLIRVRDRGEFSSESAEI